MIKQETRDALLEMLPSILTIKDATAFLRCSDMTIRRAIWDGSLVAYKADGEWNIARLDFLTYLSRHSSF